MSVVDQLIDLLRGDPVQAARGALNAIGQTLMIAASLV